MWTTGLLAPAGLADKDRRREALRVHFTADGEADASEIGGGGGGGGEGGGEVGGEAMILYTSLKCKFGLQTNIDINNSLYSKTIK